MYNKYQKEEFIKTNSANEISLINYFERVKVGENKYKKDLLKMNQEETIDTLLLLEIRSLASRRHVLSLLKLYAEWATANGTVKNTPFIVNISPKDIFSEKAYQKQMLKNPEQVQYIIDKCYSGINYWERADRDAAVLWLLYSGFTIKDLSYLTIKHIFADENIITSPISGIQYTVVPETIKYCEKTEMLEKIERRVAHNPSGRVVYELEKTPYLFKPIVPFDGVKKKKDYIEENGFFNIINYIFKLYGKDELMVSPNNIRISGLYYKIYKKDNAGEYLSEKLFGDVFNTNKVKNLMEEYYEWKKAFGY